jgi:choline dehydrogenase-like flavoprotein
MIRDGRAIESGTRLDFDIIIVGGGAAGITLALELENTGARIGLIEAGGLRYEPDSQALLDGELVGNPYPPLTDTRFSALGGSTKLWAGWCRPLDESDFEARPWVPNSGWPFGRAEMDPYYRRAHEICRLGDFEYDPSIWEARGSGKRLPLSDPDLTTSVFHVNVLDFGKTHGPALRSSRNVNVVLHAIALRLRSAANGAVESAEIATLTGRRFEARAQIFVLAAGGIENARVLLLSGDSPERSLGNDRDLVGRYFSDHPFLTPGSFVV